MTASKRSAARRSIPVQPQPTRHCGACTACCDGWLRIEIDQQQVYPGQPCPHRCDAGCRIYENRPQDPCREFVCGWLMANSPLPDDFSPDRCGVIIMFGISSWQGFAVDAIIPAGRDPDARVLGWMQTWALKRQRPFYWQEKGEWLAFGPPQFQQEALKRVRQGENPWTYGETT